MTIPTGETTQEVHLGIEVGQDDLIVEFERPDAYIESEVQCAYIELRDKLLDVINRRF